MEFRRVLFRSAVDLVEPGGIHRREHPLLGFTRQDLERLQARLTKGNGVEVQLHPPSSPGRGLAGRAGQPSSAEILQAKQESALDELQAGLDEQLPGDGVPDLYA